MTDDPAHDYDVWCRDHAEPEDCERCEGTGSMGHPASPPGVHGQFVECEACGGSGFEHDAERHRQAEQYATDVSAMAEVLVPLFDAIDGAKP